MSSNSYSSKFDINKEPVLKKKLETAGFIFQQAPHAFWRAQKNGLTATLYNSGKLLIQGKDVESFTKELFDEEGTACQQNLSLIQPKAPQSKFSSWIGTDESGKGDYFGPLVIAGVLVDGENIKKLSEFNIQDSKKLTDATIEKVALQIKANSVFSVVTINPAKYNELYEKFKNLNTLLAWGHARVIENILEKNPCQNALSDKFGNESLIKNALLKKGREINLEQRVRAESDLAVAAASILARNEFVQRMKKLSEEYGINFQKGASEKVKEQAKEYIKKYGRDSLKNLAKLHFKTTKEI
jgi:ribonuclease HIII